MNSAINGFVENWRCFFLEITNRCNFDCVFCPLGISKRPKQNMDRRLAFSLIDQLQALGFNKRIYFHVLGEPLLHPAVFDIVDHAAEAGMEPVIFTNGGALTNKVVQGILASKASELVISMQTINRQSYEKLRKTPFGWNTYLGRIQTALATANEAAKNDCTFRVSMGIKKKDSPHPEDLYFLEYESPEQIRESIANIFSQVKGCNLIDVFSAFDVHDLLSAPTVQITERLTLSVKSMGNWRRVWRDDRVTAGYCQFFGQEMAVLSNGDVTFCHIDYDGRTVIGNVGEKPLAVIMKAPEVGQVFKEFRIHNVVPEACQCCQAVKG
ncbi:radical SAM/SPASM domain-containing protein [Chloroflexota bacterium]